jgi:ATP-dependent Clp protease ATP-binding subunit ClpC
MTMWEPFSEPARRAVVRSQEVAQMFGAHYIGTEHMVFALAETDDPVGAALAKAVDRDALRKQLGEVSREPTLEMVFTPGAKRSIELAFENARRLNHDYIGTAHIALGILGTREPPPLLPGEDIGLLRVRLERAARHDGPPGATSRTWKRAPSPNDNPVADAVEHALSFLEDFGKTGTRISMTVAVPGEAELTWSWHKVKKK